MLVPGLELPLLALGLELPLLASVRVLAMELVLALLPALLPKPRSRQDLPLPLHNSFHLLLLYRFCSLVFFPSTWCNVMSSIQACRMLPPRPGLIVEAVQPFHDGAGPPQAR